MVTQEGAPSLGGRPGSLDHVLRDARNLGRTCTGRSRQLAWRLRSFDHLVGEGEQLVRHGEAERLGGPEVYEQLVFRQLLYGEGTGRGTSQNLIHVLRTCA